MKSKILIVDDSVTIRSVVSRQLEESGYLVVETDNPIMLAYYIRKEKPDIVIMDVDMPSISGDRAVSYISGTSTLKAPKVLLYSSHPIEKLRQLAESCGVKHVLTKGANLVPLLLKIRQMLDE